MSKAEDIKISKDSFMGENHSHPAFAQISISRSTCGGSGTELYGSSLRHNNIITMRLHHSELNRSLNKDWYHERGLIAEIDMSQSQFAEMITSFGMGDGVPCTLRYTEKDGQIPLCTFENKRSQYKHEFDEKIGGAFSDTEKLINDVERMFDLKKALTKKEKEEILSTLLKIKYNIGSNLKFAASQFDKQMDKTIMEAKGEIEAFTQSRITSIANKAIAENGGIEEFKAVSLIENTKEDDKKCLP